MDRNPVVLCIDSDRTGLMIRRAVLETAQYTILTAPDASFALAIMRSIPVDILITEQSLPSMTGVELAKQCKRLRPQTRVMLLTSSPYYPPSNDVDEQFCKLEGPVAMLEKVAELATRRKPMARAMAVAAAASAA